MGGKRTWARKYIYFCLAILMLLTTGGCASVKALFNEPKLRRLRSFPALINQGILMQR
jgi:hypothetical protein